MRDGTFDDAQGPSASVSFAAAGQYVVKLLVIDRDGAAGLAQHTIDVQAPVAQFLRPFPVVRVVGAVGERGTRIREIVVTVPEGSRVAITCRGGGCPRTRAKRGATAARTVHMRRFARAAAAPRRSRADRVTKPGAIGKYTRIRIRRGRSPSRVDRCLAPGAVPARTAVRCSGSLAFGGMCGPPTTSPGAGGPLPQAARTCLAARCTATCTGADRRAGDRRASSAWAARRCTAGSARGRG